MIYRGPNFKRVATWGRRSSVVARRTYRLRVEFSGSQTTVYENDFQQFSVFDDAYASGQIGLRTFRAQARFANIRIRPASPRCFVIMPFTSELCFVYRVMKEVVESRIAEADLVIVDFTGKNPNVYYEAGLADAYKKDWILLAQTSEDMTFDVRDLRSVALQQHDGRNIASEMPPREMTMIQRPTSGPVLTKPCGAPRGPYTSPQLEQGAVEAKVIAFADDKRGCVRCVIL